MSTPPALEALKIEVTQRCSLACKHCSTDAGPSRTTALAAEAVGRLIREAAQLGAAEVTFSGGEPLLRPELAAFVGAAAGASMRPHLYTSGLLTPDSVPADEGRFRTLREAGLQKVTFTLLGASAASHERMTLVAGSFAATRRAGEAAVRSGLECGFHFVPVRANFRELLDIVGIAANMGFSQVSLLRFVPQGRGRPFAPRQALSAADHAELRSLVLAARRQASVAVRCGSPYNFLLAGRPTACTAASKTATVSPSGRAYPCDAFKNIEPEMFGFPCSETDVLQRGLVSVWRESHYFSSVREAAAAAPAERCAGCANFPRCGSGCLAQRAIATGLLGAGADPDCLLQVETPQ